MNLTTLNKHLFDQLDKLQNAPDEDALKIELTRSNAIGNIARNVIDSAKLSLDADKHIAEYGNIRKQPKMLE